MREDFIAVEGFSDGVGGEETSSVVGKGSSDNLWKGMGIGMHIRRSVTAREMGD